MIRDIPASKTTYFIISLIAFTQGIIPHSIFLINNKGVTELSRLALNYLFKDDYLIDPYQMSLIFSLTSIPWVIKPLWGFISDSFPIFSYRRKSYLIFLSFVQTGFWIVLALYPFGNLYLVVLCILFIEVCMAFCNVIGGNR